MLTEIRISLVIPNMNHIKEEIEFMKWCIISDFFEWISGEDEISIWSLKSVL